MSAIGVPLRRIRTTQVVASPAGSAETRIAITPAASFAPDNAFDIEGSVDLTIGSGGVSVTLNVRWGNSTGDILIASYGPFTVVAGNRYNFTANGVYQTPVDHIDKQLALFVVVGSAVAQSTVNGVYLLAVY